MIDATIDPCRQSVNFSRLIRKALDQSASSEKNWIVNFRSHLGYTCLCRRCRKGGETIASIFKTAPLLYHFFSFSFSSSLIISFHFSLFLCFSLSLSFSISLPFCLSWIPVISACKRKDEMANQAEHQQPAPKKPRLVFTDLQRRTLQAIFKVSNRVLTYTEKNSFSTHSKFSDAYGKLTFVTMRLHLAKKFLFLFTENILPNL